MPPTVPFNHYKSPRNQQNKTLVLFYHSMLQYSRLGYACFEHSNFLKVNDGEWKAPKRPPLLMTAWNNLLLSPRKDTQAWYSPFRRTTSWAIRNPTTSFLTATTFIYAIGAGITAAAGTRLALQLFLVKGFKLYSFQHHDPVGPCIGISVTTSPYRDWVICAPAAFRGSCSHLSGSISGIEP